MRMLPIVFFAVLALCWLYLRQPGIAYKVEWYLRLGAALAMAALLTFVAYGAFS